MTHPSRPPANTRDRPGGKVRLGCTVCGDGISFHAIVGFGAKERAAELGADLSIISVFTPEQQATAVQQLAAAHVDVLIIDALESEIVLPALQEIAAAGTPVIAADGSVHGVEVACAVHSANVRGGQLAARFIVEQLQGRGTIAHLQGLLTSDNSVERSRGFHAVVDGYEEIRTVEASAAWTRESGVIAMRELLAVHPTIDAVFAHNDAQALGALDALTEAGRAEGVVVVGFDGIPEALIAIARGTMAATVRQMPQATGRLAVELALRVHAGEEVPPVVETDVTLVTPANVAETSLETLPLFPPILGDLAERGAALAEERTLLRTLIDNLPDLIYVKDLDSRFVLVNEAGAAYFGIPTPDDAVGKSDYDFFPPADASRFRADEQAILEADRPLINHEERSPAANGDVHWLSTTKVPTHNVSGRIVGLVGMSRDITRQKALEAERMRLLEEQAALRRVATLVGAGVEPDELFSAVAAEVAAVSGLPVVAVNRFEADRTFTILGIAGEVHVAAGSRWPIENSGIAGMVLSTGRPARWDDYATLPGRLGDALRGARLGSTVGVPVVVEGQTWGFLVAAARHGTPIPADTEAHLARFTELVATAVSNASARSELLSSRARLISMADETRRRLERDLHDGIQQWLVALALRARRAAGLATAGDAIAKELSGLADDLVSVTDELREISRGIHPAILSDAGLDAALASLARRSAVRVDLDIRLARRFDPTVEATAYYVVAESITNAIKHARASTVVVRGGLHGERIEFVITDDGIGGADPRRGTGLIGLKDRVDTLGGSFAIESPAGSGTTIEVSLPGVPAGGERTSFEGSADVASLSTSG